MRAQACQLLTELVMVFVERIASRTLKVMTRMSDGEVLPQSPVEGLQAPSEAAGSARVIIEASSASADVFILGTPCGFRNDARPFRAGRRRMRLSSTLNPKRIRAGSKPDHGAQH